MEIYIKYLSDEDQFEYGARDHNGEPFQYTDELETVVKAVLEDFLDTLDGVGSHPLFEVLEGGKK